MSIMSTEQSTTPRASLSIGDGIAMMVGLIIGVGIFKLPFLVALNVDSSAMFVGLWVVGGVITLIGALVYAELAAAYPSTGGEYHFLTRAYGNDVGLLFAWARTTVIQTGAIAAVAFVFGDYAQQLWPLGVYGPSIYAAASLVFLTLINLAGTYQSKNAQIVFTILEVGALLFVSFVGFALASPAPSAAAAPAASGGALGLAIVFILFTYGGWNEAAYLSKDVRDAHRNIVRILIAGTLTVTALYLLINLAYLNVLGLEGMRKSPAIAADLMRAGLGATGAVLLSLFVCCAALSTINASIFTGARVYHALGEDLAVRSLSFWSGSGNNPRNAIYIQSAIALALIGFGATTKEGFEAMVNYTAPVFWFFLFLVGVSSIILRQREPNHARPFRMPLYPVTPALFCLTCLYLLYSSIAYAGRGALIGVVVLLLGIPLVLVGRAKARA
jgi:basic amino acid/polyamine antiporter, APA family